MCGRCSGFRGAIELSPRAPNREIVEVAGLTPKPVETLLIVFGLHGRRRRRLPLERQPLVCRRSSRRSRPGSIDLGVIWPLEPSAPWWILTNYPDVNDQLTLLDGAVLLFYIAATALVIGALVCVCLYVATRCLGAWSAPRFHHFAQSLIPIAGLRRVSRPQRHDRLSAAGRGRFLRFPEPLARGRCSPGRRFGRSSSPGRSPGARRQRLPRRAGATLSVALAASIGVLSWALLFWILVSGGGSGTPRASWPPKVMTDPEGTSWPDLIRPPSWSAAATGRTGQARA